MKDQSEATGSSTGGQWFGLDRLRISDGDKAVDVTIGSESHWDRTHLRRLRQSGDLPGMVPVIDSDFSADGRPFAVTPAMDEPTLASLMDAGDLDWTSGAGITEAAARAAHEGHLRGLFHGGLSPDDIYLLDDDIAIGGIGLGLGGVPSPDRSNWVAPEVRKGSDPTERSDVYSLGKILERSLGEALDSAPRSIRRLIMWSSSDTPEARPPSAMEFASILAESLGEDRRIYGPAFIATGDSSDLASKAGSAVADHRPSADSPSGVAIAGAGLAGAILGDDDTVEAPDVGAADAGFTVNETVETSDIDPALDLDVPDAEPEDEDGDEPGDEAQDNGEETDEEPDVDGDDEYAVLAAADTVDFDEALVPAKRRNWAGLAIGAILALGLAAIVWGILISSDDELDSTAPEAAVTTTAEAPTANTTEAPVSTTAEAPTSAEAPATTTEATTTTTALVVASPESLAPTADGPISAANAGLQLLHGVPGAEVDVYVDGEAIATGFSSGSIAGPIDLEPGSYDFALYLAASPAPANASDRSDEALATSSVSVGSKPASLVAYLDESGDVALSTFTEDLSALDPGQSRINVRHLMEGGPVDASVNGEIVATLDPGQEIAIEVDAGSVLVEFLGSDGAVLASANVTVNDGELASLSAIGAPADDTADVVIQRYSGLATAPTGVPTGDSGLLDLSDEDTGLKLAYGLMVLLTVSGGVVALRRRHRLS